MPNFDDILPMLNSSKCHRIAMLIYPGAVLADIAGPCELFRRARDADGQLQYDVLMCGTSKRVRTDACTLLLEHGLGAVARATTLLVPGTSEPTRALPPAVIEAIQHAAKRKLRIASICTGAFALAAAGLLDGREATTHWAAAAALAAAYPRVRVNPNVLYVAHRNLLTSAGAAAGLDMCLHMIRADCGASTARRSARMAVLPLEREGGQAQYIDAQPDVRQTASLQRLLTWIERNLAEDMNVDALASRVALSARTLHRRFTAETGSTPAVWVQRARIRKAQVLLETSKASIEAIAASVGFAATSTFRERFQSQLGINPSQYRRAFVKRPR